MTQSRVLHADIISQARKSLEQLHSRRFVQRQSVRLRRPYFALLRAGRGRVVHMISHLYLQRSELRGEPDRLPATAVAGGLGFAEDSTAVKELRRKGLDGAKAGRVRSAYSAQQFLANLLVSAARGASPPPKPPTPPTPPPPSPPPTVRDTVTTVRAVMLRAAPSGDAVKTYMRIRWS